MPIRIIVSVFLACAVLSAQSPPSWTTTEAETLRHFQELLKFDTSDPPGREAPAAEYLKKVLEQEGIPVELIEIEPGRPNVVARLKGSGAKRPCFSWGIPTW